MNKLSTVLCTLALFLATAPLRAAEKESEGSEKSLQRAEVPPAVINAVTKKYPKAKLKKFEQEQEEGKTVYEVQIATGKDQISIDVTPEGKILAEETIIATSALPPAVKEGLAASKYQGWKIAKAEKVIENEKDDAPAYELVVQSKKARFEVVLDQTGKITKEEAKSGRDLD